MNARPRAVLAVVGTALRRDAAIRRRRDQSGVTLVEFAIVLPMFFSLVFAMIEFGVAFNAELAINRASQSGALMAGQVGSDPNADCVILARVESQLNSPLNRNNVLQVRIFRTNTTGSSILVSDTYVRSGSKDCGTYTVPYSATSTGYPPSQRCSVLAGCPTLTPPRSTVDKIGVSITYRHVPITPMRDLLSFLGGSGSGFDWTFQKQNESRMEPVL